MPSWQEVGAAVWSARVDRSKLKPDLDAAAADVKKTSDASEKAATDSASRTVAKISTLTRTAISTVALGAGAIFAAGTKLAIEGTDAMAKFQAQTGATADEAKAAFDSMNRLAGSNLQSFNSVAATLTEVSVQMGLTGKAAEDMTDAILKFSTATGQDAVEAVRAFDDVSDAWNLTADETKQVMDALIVSHQKYGGSIAESEDLLNKLAPALQAANMNWQDATALLNLFNHAGVSADAAATGLNRALSKVKSPEELQQLIKDIAATKDPFERAQKAVDAFGTKAGPKLALALADSGGDLDQFMVSMDDAAGATDKAASAIEDTLPNKVKLAVSGALAQARTLATDLGPALMGAGAIANIGTGLASALKLDDALKGAWTKAATSGPMLAAARAAGTAGGAAAGAAATAATIAAPIVLFATLVISLEKVLPKLPNNMSEVTNPDAPDLRAWWMKLLHIGDPTSGPEAVGVEAGQQAAKGVGEGLALGPPTPAIDVFRQSWFAKTLGLDHIGEVGATAADSFFEGISKAAGNKNWNIVLGPFLEHDTSFGKAGAKAADAFIHGVQDAKYPQNVMDNLDPVPQLSQQIKDEAPQISDALTHTWSAVPTAPARLLGVHFGEQYIVGFKSTRDEAKSEWQQYLDDLAHPNRGKKTVGWVVGRLTGEDLAKGLASADPIVRHSAEQEQQNLRVTLQKLIDAGYPIGKKTLEKLGLGIKGGKLVAVDAATTATTAIKKPFNNTSGLYGYGADFVTRWAAGMLSQQEYAEGIAGNIVLKVGQRFVDDVPIPADAPEHIRRIGEYGQHFIQRWVGGMWSQGDVAARSVSALGAHITGSLFGGGSLSSLTVGATSTVRHEHGGTVRVELSGQTVAGMRQAGMTPEEIGRAARAASGIGDVLVELGRMRTLPIGASVG